MESLSTNTESEADADAFDKIAWPDLRPTPVILLAGTAAVAALSFAFLAWPQALASTLLGSLMVYGAEIDARDFLLPDLVTLGGAAIGIIAQALLEPGWEACGLAVLRALCLAGLLELFRQAFFRLRGQEGLGFGDVKLAAVIGAWLTLDAIPLCFALAAGAGLITVALASLRGEKLDARMRLPFGLFLCPALWFVNYVSLISTGV